MLFSWIFRGIATKTSSYHRAQALRRPKTPCFARLQTFLKKMQMHNLADLTLARATIQDWLSQSAG
ncbi:hypothetical protein CCR95_08945 [Thiocystis minor]|nr:hypothetical protein [Thiocystis minor]